MTPGELKLRKTIMELVVEARKRASISQAKMGAIIGVAAQSVNYWEGGHRRPTIDNLYAIAEVAGGELYIGIRYPEGEPYPVCNANKK